MLDFVREEPNRCDGCEACASRCASASIRMVEDVEGFRYPSVDAGTCTSCGACEEVCPALRPRDAGTRAPRVYAARSVDAATRGASSSGGVFSELAEDTLRRGGLVFGAAFDGALELRHVGVESSADLAPLRGSKYVPSLLGESLREVRRHADAGRPVLFVGTPCQVGGLRAYIGRPRDSLVTVDLVCHGVPSLRLFRQFRGWLERRHRGSLAEIQFRDKRNGWRRFEVVATFADGRQHRSHHRVDAFMRAFLGNLCLRPACHECRWARIPRVGDLTLGDYWGISGAGAEVDDDRGTSAVLVNGDKGLAALERVSSRLVLKETPLAPAVAGNPCLVRPAVASPRRASFMRDLSAAPFDALVSKYLRPPSAAARFYGRVRSRLRAMVSRLLR